jgi:hypothetical protein
MAESEMKTFRHLKQIVDALHGCPDPDPGSTRQSNGYHYQDCAYEEMASEIIGANFRIDAAIANPDVYKEGEQDITLAAAQTAVAMEFKKQAIADKVYEVSALTAALTSYSS